MTNIFQIPETYLAEHSEVIEDYLEALKKYGTETPETVGEAFKYAIGEIIIQYGEAVGMMVEEVVRDGVRRDAIKRQAS